MALLKRYGPSYPSLGHAQAKLRDSVFKDRVRESTLNKWAEEWWNKQAEQDSATGPPKEKKAPRAKRPKAARPASPRVELPPKGRKVAKEEITLGDLETVQGLEAALAGRLRFDEIAPIVAAVNKLGGCARASLIHQELVKLRGITSSTNPSGDGAMGGDTG